LKQQDENLILVADPSPFPDKNLFWRSKFWIEPKRAMGTNHPHDDQQHESGFPFFFIMMSCKGIAISGDLI